MYITIWNYIQLYMMARAERERVVQHVYKKVESSRPDLARPVRPAISATRISAMKKADFGTPVLVALGP